MTIRLGEATVSGLDITLPAPGGFGTFQALRLTNYTGSILECYGIKSDDASSAEYLLPMQQNVYKTQNINFTPTIRGIPLGTLTTVPTVLAEWSDDPLYDFPGTYPTSLGAPSTFPNAFVQVFTVTSSGRFSVIEFTEETYGSSPSARNAIGASVEIEANPLRQSATFKNITNIHLPTTTPDNLALWSTILPSMGGWSATDGGHLPIINQSAYLSGAWTSFTLPGPQTTLRTSSALYFHCYTT